MRNLHQLRQTLHKFMQNFTHNYTEIYNFTDNSDYRKLQTIVHMNTITVAHGDMGEVEVVSLHTVGALSWHILWNTMHCAVRVICLSLTMFLDSMYCSALGIVILS